MTTADQDLAELDADALRQLVQSLRGEVAFKQALIDKLTHENATLKRLKYAAKSEAYTAEQRSLLEDVFDADLAAVDAELGQADPNRTAVKERNRPKREPLPSNLPRREIRHEPASTTCGCGKAMKRIGEEVSEKLDYQPGVFTVERHIRGKWACACCQTMAVAPVAPHVIDKGIPTAALLAQVIVAKYIDHIPLYRQEQIYGRAGFAIPRSTLAEWVGRCGVALQPLVDALADVVRSRGVLHADETPVAMLTPENTGKTHKAYVWTYCTTVFDEIKAVVFDFADGRSGQNARDFLGLDIERPEVGWKGRLVTDDFSGYKACFKLGVTEVGCMAHARRKFHALWANHGSVIGEQALERWRQIYEIERRAQHLSVEDRRALRQEETRPLVDALKKWLLQQRQLVPTGSATAAAIDYNLKRWEALVRFVDDGELPIDQNWVENQIRPIALGRSNWLFAGSLRAGKRSAAVMSLAHSARINGLDPRAYLADVLERLPTHPNSRISELLPHLWKPATD